MKSNEDLTKSAMTWLKMQAADCIGPCEVNVQTDEIEEKTTFKIKLLSHPPEIDYEENTNDNKVSIQLYLDIIQNTYIEVISYLNLEIKSEKYSDACELSNYVNIRSNLSFFQIFKDDAQLVVRIKSASTASQGAGDNDFYSLVLSTVGCAYTYWQLFATLASSNLSAQEITSDFETSLDE